MPPLDGRKPLSTSPSGASCESMSECPELKPNCLSFWCQPGAATRRLAARGKQSSLSLSALLADSSVNRNVCVSGKLRQDQFAFGCMRHREPHRRLSSPLCSLFLIQVSDAPNLPCMYIRAGSMKLRRKGYRRLRSGNYFPQLQVWKCLWSSVACR